MMCSPYGVKPYYKQLLNMAFKKKRSGYIQLPEVHRIKENEEEQ